MSDHILVQIMSQMTALSDEESAAIANSFPIQTFTKGHFLLKEGMIAHNAYFVIEGCIREYEILDGEEKTTEFYTENDSAIDFASQTSKTPSSKYFECLEETTVAVVNSEKEQALYKQFPRFEKFSLEGIEQMMGAKQKAMSNYILLSPKERYLLLLENKPELSNRVPQYYIASYLGIKPETLSRIRKKLSTKN